MDFVYTLVGDPATKLATIKRKAAWQLVTFLGDLSEGTFSGGFGNMTVRGSYRIVGDTITVTVSEKPGSYSWEKVHSMLRSFIESN